jgi:hypothetical protein
VAPSRHHQLIRLLAGVVAFDLAVACAAVVLQDRWVGDPSAKTVVAAEGAVDNSNGILAAGRFNGRRKPTRTSTGATSATSVPTTAPALPAPSARPATGASQTTSTAPGRPSSTGAPRAPRTAPQPTTATTGAVTAPAPAHGPSTPTTAPAATSPDAPAAGNDPAPSAPPDSTGTVAPAKSAPPVSRDGWLIIDDPAGDTIEDGSRNPRTDGRGDILKSAATNKAKGVVLTAQVAQRSDPTRDPNWASASTYMLWELDTNNDGAPDYEVQYFLEGGKLVAGVNRAGSDSDSGCQAEAGYMQESYAVGIDPECIGAPAAFTYRVTIYYDPDPKDENAEVITDVSPDGGMSPAIKRSAG